MAMSEETQSIIDTLRAEGMLVRNTGTNSIKSVNLNLGKFKDVFDSMNNNIEMLGTKISDNALIEEIKHQNELAIQAADKRSLLEMETADELVEKMNDVEYQQKEIAEDEKKERIERDKRQEERERRERRSLFGRDGILSSVFSNSFGLIKKALFLGIGGAFLYELSAGFLERTTGIRLPTLAEGLTALGEFVTEINWEGLKENLNALANADIAKWLIGAAAVAAGREIFPIASQALQTGLTFEILRRMVTPTAADASAAGAKRVGGRTVLAAVRGGIAGLVFAGLLGVMPTFENLFRRYALDMTETEIENIRFDATTIGGNVAIGAAGALTLKYLLGIGGPKAWAVGATIFAFKTVYDYLESKIDDDVTRNVVQDIRVEEERANKKLREMLDIYQWALKNAPELAPEFLKEIEEYKRILEESQTKQLAEDIQEIQRRMELRGPRPTMADIPTFEFQGATQYSPGRRVELSEMERARRLMKRQEAYDESMALSQAQIAKNIEEASRLGITPEQLGLIMGPLNTWVTQDLARRQSDRISASLAEVRSREIQQQAIDQYNAQMSEEERMFRGEVTSTQQILDRLNMAGMGTSVLQQIFNNLGGDTIINAPNVNSTSSTNNLNAFGNGGNQYAAFPGALN